MKRTCLIIFLFFQALNINAQFTASDFYKNHSEKLDKRNQWMFNQRLYPYADNLLIEKSYKQREQSRLLGLTDNSSSWVSLGPNPGQFNFVNTASRVRVIAYDPDSTNTVYIGTSNGGVWKTTDGGLNWSPKTDFEPSLSSGALAVYNDWNSSPPKRIVYYGTGEGGFGFVYNYYGRGLLKSTDGGETWRQITNGLPSTTYFYRIAINPASPNVLLAALGTGYANPVNTGGLYRSEDYGESWTRIVPASIGEEGLNCTDVLFSPDGTKAYVLGPFTTGSPNWWENGCGYRISNDGGRTFTQVSVNLPGTGYLAISKSSPLIMYALVATDCNQSQLYRSADGGQTWAWINESFSTNQCGYNMAVEMHPVNPNIIFVATLILYESTNRGNDFFVGRESFHLDCHDIEFNPKNPNELMVATDGGVVKSTNLGTTFQNINKTMTTLECYSVSSDPINDSHILAGSQDNGLQQKPDESQNWVGMTGYDATTVIIDQDDPNRYIIQLSASPKGIHFSLNKGSTWFESGGFAETYKYSWQRPIVKFPSAGGYLTSYEDKIYKTTNYGQNWFQLSVESLPEYIQEIAVSQSNPNVIYAATGPFEYMPNSTQHFLFKSTNSGQNWINLSAYQKGAGLPNRYISSIQIDKDNENEVYAAFAGFGTNHIYYSNDGGQSWASIDCDGSNCLPDAPVNDLVIHYGTENNTRDLYIATDVGIFAKNGESIWHELSEGLPNCIVMDLNITGNKLKAATYGRGIYEWDLSGTSLAGKNPNYTGKIVTYNYPNPFNPSTEIRFEINTKSDVKLEIFDIAGRLITQLANGIMEPSVYKYTWDGTKYSSGVYFYRLNVNGKIFTQKMLLIK